MQTYVRDGLTFEVADHGPRDGEVVVLLHGFPQTNLSWTAVADRLADAGYRTLAPNQRGYSPGARIRGRRNFRVTELVTDAAALIDSAGTAPAHVVGHDWGAVVAWLLAAHRPELVRTVTGVSVPHPGAFLKSLTTSRQALHSWYMLALQVPVLPEWLLDRPGVVERLLVRSGQAADDAARDAAALAASPSGPIDWYRGLLLSSRGFSRKHVTRPALQIWGQKDPFVTRAAIDHNAEVMDGPYRLEVLPHVGHWIPDQVPDHLARLIEQHLAGR